MMKKNKISDSSGFSFVELMVVVALVGILSAIGIPAFLSRLPDMRLRAAARDVYADLQKVKLETIKRASCACVDFTTDGYQGFFDDESGAGTVRCNGIKDDDDDDGDSAGETYFFSNKLIDSGVSLDSIDSTLSRPVASDATSATPAIEGSVCYNSQGLVYSSRMGSIALTNNNSLLLRVRVRPAGGLQIEMSTDNGVTWN